MENSVGKVFANTICCHRSAQQLVAVLQVRFMNLKRVSKQDETFHYELKVAVCGGIKIVFCREFLTVCGESLFMFERNNSLECREGKNGRKVNQN